MEKKIILATKSLHRIKAFSALEVPFVAEGSDINENFNDRPKDPEYLVHTLAKLKAQAVAGKQKDPSIVVGFDSVTWFDGQILEKPKAREEAFSRLMAMSGKWYWFLTGVRMVNVPEGKFFSQIEKTFAVMRDYSGKEIEKYLDQDKNQDYLTYSQGFDPLNTFGSTFIKKIEGSYNNILRGIPLELLVEMFKRAGYPIV